MDRIKKYQLGGSYSVQQGDTLSKIAKKLNIPIQTLVQDNSIKDANKIYIGQNIKYKSPGVPTPASFNEVRGRNVSVNPAIAPVTTAIQEVISTPPVVKEKGALNISDFLISDEDLAYLNNPKNNMCSEKNSECLAGA
jgi:LysM repeat protein